MAFQSRLANNEGYTESSPTYSTPSSSAHLSWWAILRTPTFDPNSNIGSHFVSLDGSNWHWTQEWLDTSNQYKTEIRWTTAGATQRLIGQDESTEFWPKDEWVFVLVNNNGSSAGLPRLFYGAYGSAIAEIATYSTNRHGGSGAYAPGTFSNLNVGYNGSRGPQAWIYALGEFRGVDPAPALMEQIRARPWSPPVAHTFHYVFDGPASTIPDLSGNGHVLTRTGTCVQQDNPPVGRPRALISLARPVTPPAKSEPGFLAHMIRTRAGSAVRRM